MRRSPGTPTRSAYLVAPLVIGTVLTLVGCSGDDGESDGGGGEPTTGGEAADTGIDTRVEVGEVAGTLGKGPAREVAAEVAGVVDGWLDAAYLAGDYPRSEFGDAFPGFTKDAATLAGRQRGLMSNAAVGADVDAVTATRRVVRVDVLAPKGKVAAATAHVNLVIELTGEVQRTDQVRGRVVLTRSKSGWRVFGFDIERGAVRG